MQQRGVMTRAAASLVCGLAVVASVATVGAGRARAGGACDDPARVYRDGVAGVQVCGDKAAGEGLTVLDLSPSWTPAILAPGPDGVAPAYRAIYLALAGGDLGRAGDDGVIAADDRFLEIYGVVPSLTTIGGWLTDDTRHACHAAIDDTELAAFVGNPRDESAATARARARKTAARQAALERAREKQGLADLDAVAATSRYLARELARVRTDLAYTAAVAALQAHLACEGLEPDTGGRYGWRTRGALTRFQRRELLSPRGRLDDATRDALIADSRERDFRAALRALRERVVSATGLIEDGSAGAGQDAVLGLRLDPPTFDHVVGHPPLPGAAPDLISAATEAAARALGWTDPAATAAFLTRPVPARVAVALPPLPDRRGTTLAVEIDRGDVWYDARPTVRKLDRRPALTLFALAGDVRTPLVRWPTTIGGWQDEKRPSGAVSPRWKESPVGPRVWRELFVGPTWLPPDTTPDGELVRKVGSRHELAREAMGPSYKSAYGLTMLVHELVVTRRSKVSFHDQGVRTHGSSAVGSVHGGRSHGCHRLLPAQVLRLGGFLVATVDHVRRGETPTLYVRTFSHHGRFPVKITTRGYLIELTPPIAVEVLPGRIRSRRARPPR